MASRLTLILLLLSLAPLCSAEPCRNDLLPREVTQVLEHKFPNWRPKRFSDLSSDDQRVWSEYHPRACPGIAVGHFESADRAAYAILLIPKSRDHSGSKIIIVSEGPQGYAVRLLDQDKGTGPDSGLVISRQPAGAYSNFGDTRTVRLKLDAVEVEWLEKSSTLYYWSHGRYRSMPTSD